MNTINTPDITSRAATPMSIGRRITMTAMATIGVAAALSLTAGPVAVASAATSAPGTIAASWCPRPPTTVGKPGHLPQVVTSSKCSPGSTDGSVSGPDGNTSDNPGDGTIDAGDGSICVGDEIECHQPF